MAIAAIRYNNPGNVSLPIRGYSGPGEIVGIKGQAGYASFPTLADGLKAQAARLTSYIDRGVGGSGPLTSIAALNSKYAEDPNWKNAVSRFSGIGINQQLDSSNPQQLAALQGAIIRQETGKDPSVFGFGANNNNVPGLTAPATANGGMFGSVDTRAGNQVTGFTSATGRENDATEVTLGFDGDNPSGVGAGSGSVQTTGFDSTGGFTGANVAGDSKAGAFGLGGITSGGQTVGAGNAGAGGTSGGDPIVGYNAAGPVMGAPTVTAAINQSGQKVSGSVDKGAKQIGDDTKAAGKTIGDSITGLAKTAQSISQTWNQWASDTFVRLAFIITGLVIFGAALMYFARPQLEAVARATPIGKLIPK